MAMRINPVTGLQEEDGAPVPGIAGVDSPIVIDMQRTPEGETLDQWNASQAAAQPLPDKDPMLAMAASRYGSIDRPAQAAAAANGAAGAPGSAWGGDNSGGGKPVPQSNPNGGVDEKGNDVGAPAPAAAAPQFPALASEPAPPIDPGLTVQTSRIKQSALALQGQKEGMAAAGEAVGIAGRQGAMNEEKAKENARLVNNESAVREQQRQIEAQGRLDLKNRLDAANAERDRILADAEKKSQADYWTDKPAGARVISMFTSAVGAYLAVRNGGPNVMQDQLDKLISRDDAKKQQELQYQIKKHGMRGEAAQKAFDYGTMELGLRKAAVYDQLADLRANALAAKGVDQATIDKDVLINHANQASAGLKEGYGEKANVHIQTSNALQQQAKLAAAQAQAQPNGASATLQEREKSEAAAKAAIELERAREFASKHPKALAEMQEAMLEQAKDNAAAKTKLGSELYNTAQYMGKADISIEQKLKTPEAKELWSIMLPVRREKARSIDPEGVLNQGSVEIGDQSMGLMTRGHKEIVNEIGTLRDQNIARAQAARGFTGYTPPSTIGTPLQSQFAPPETVTKAQLAQGLVKYKEAIKANPKDERLKQSFEDWKAFYRGKGVSL